MLIRPFRLGDYSAITSIWQQTGLDQSDTVSLNDLAQQLAWDSDLVMVAEKDGKVVGVVVGTIDGARAYFYRWLFFPRCKVPVSAANSWLPSKSASNSEASITS